MKRNINMCKKNKSPLDDLIALEQDARDFGFDWPDQKMIIDYVMSECKEILDAIDTLEPPHRIQEEIGDLLHSAVSLCFFSGFDVDETLANVNKKFGTRMAHLKEITKKLGLTDLKGQSFDFMIELWKEAKKAS